MSREDEAYKSDIYLRTTLRRARCRCGRHVCGNIETKKQLAVWQIQSGGYLDLRLQCVIRNNFMLTGILNQKVHEEMRSK